MMAQRYVDDLLWLVTFSYFQGVLKDFYQQDTARPHSGRISECALQGVQMLPWPPFSLDLFPIKYI
ncbi:hypothetical protein X975_15822, partial [Stegodyphus mimosarum]